MIVGKSLQAGAFGWRQAAHGKFGIGNIALLFCTRLRAKRACNRAITVDQSHFVTRILSKRHRCMTTAIAMRSRVAHGAQRRCERVMLDLSAFAIKGNRDKVRSAAVYVLIFQALL